MKIVGVDNHNRESVADALWMENIPEGDDTRSLAQRVCDKLNERLGDGPGKYYVVREDDYRLSRGMEDLI